jgi:hypothetical protein
MSSVDRSTGGMLDLCVVVVPDDAWVAALVCREFRDAVQSAFPRGPVTRTAGVVSSVERLELALACGCPLSPARLGHAAAMAGRADWINVVAREFGRRAYRLPFGWWRYDVRRFKCIADWQPHRVVDFRKYTRRPVDVSIATSVRVMLHRRGSRRGEPDWGTGSIHKRSLRVEIPRDFDVLAGLRPLGDYRLQIELDAGYVAPCVPEYLPLCAGTMWLILKFRGPPPAEYGVEFIGWKLRSRERSDVLASSVGVHSAPFVFRQGHGALGSTTLL